jgi:hypothetical protein
LFAINAIHTVVEVGQATWNTNGNTPLPGGFSLPGGGGMIVLPAAGTHYYVCGIHYSMGMKGTITVVDSPLSSAPVSPAPGALSIRSLYPNPLTAALSTTNTVTFTAGADGRIHLALFNALGQEVAIVFDGYLERGQSATRTINVSMFPAGVYFYRLEQGSETAQRTLTILQ